MDIVLTTLNSRYIHTAPALLFLYANLGALQKRSVVKEFFVKQDVDHIADEILDLHPQVLLFSVYIWNVEQTRRVMALLREKSPEIRIVLGGPEVSYVGEDSEILALADGVVCGEGEEVVEKLCNDLLNGFPLDSKRIQARPVPMDEIRLPYAYYSADDVAHRILYVETSRGCPYTCEYCLSSIDSSVRYVDLERLLPEMEALIERGVLLFKFLDRTFNVRIQRAIEILSFFLERWRPGMCMHLEMTPDRFPEPLRETIQLFPPGALQFEIGIQSCNQDVLDRIRRRQRVDLALESLRWLAEQRSVLLHLDLIVGLPGENEASFAEGFNQLVSLAPQQLQINLLKHLKGTPLSRHSQAFGMVYESRPPFEVLETSEIGIELMNRLRKFSKVWTLFYNREKLRESLPFVWMGSENSYACFQAFTAFVWSRFGRAHRISLLDQARVLSDFVEEKSPEHHAAFRERLRADLTANGLLCLPRWL